MPSRNERRSYRFATKCIDANGLFVEAELKGDRVTLAMNARQLRATRQLRLTHPRESTGL
jgi:hypothetical protein